MWKWHQNLNLEMNINKNLVDNFKKHAKISGIIFIILGILGIIFPPALTLTTVMIVSAVMFIAGFSAAAMTLKSKQHDWAGWLKSFILILTALYMLFYPAGGAAALGLVLSVYFFMDAFAGFGLAFSLRPQKIWLMWLFNAIVSAGLGVIFVIGWPFSSIYLIGIFVGISLIMDGVALLLGGAFVEALDEDEDEDDKGEQK